MSHHIDSLNLEILDICNLRCKHCDIWMNQDSNKLEWEDISAIVSSEYIDSRTDVTITGGEPFLHENITPIVLSLYRKGICVNTLSTNGTYEGELV